MSNTTLFSHQTPATASPARTDDSGTAADQNETLLEDVVPAGTADDTAVDGFAAEPAYDDSLPAERPATGYDAALDAAVELALAGEHVHLVGSGQSECISLHCEPEPIGGLSL